MSTNEEVLGPLIKFAIENNGLAAEEHLTTAAERCCALLPDKCRTLDQLIEQAKLNPDYFVQYYEAHVAATVTDSTAHDQ
jgi:hypothetical protein